MNKIIFSVLLLSSSMTALAQGQQDCQSMPQGSDDRINCLNRQAANNGNRTGQQQIQASSNATGCVSFLGREAASSSRPAEPVTRVRSSTVEVTGQPAVTTTTRETETSTGGQAAPTPAGMRPAATGTQVFSEINSAPEPVVATVPAGPPILVIDPASVQRAERCRAAQVTAAGARSTALDETRGTTTMDGQIQCVKVAGYTADYESCQRTSSMYDKVKIMEAGLLVIQSVQAQQNQQNVQNENAQRVATGDGQNAAYDAQIATTRKASQLNQQKAAAYAAAVLALGSQLQGWIKEGNLEQTLCSGNPMKLGNDEILVSPTQLQVPAAIRGFLKPAAVSAPATCQESVRMIYGAYPGEVIANRQAKGRFTAALMEFIGKGIAAGIAANQLGNIAKKVEEAKNATEDPYNPATFDLCQVNLADPKCAQVGSRTNGSGLQDGGFGFGDGFGNNAFTPTGTPEDMGTVDPSALPGDQVVGDTTNPFVDDAKKASGILDPAGAASTQAAAGGGSGGGGGAGAGGGGSASLGNDTPGADDSKKENDIKANKADGKYAAFAGGGFQAIKPMKDENPFANLFDGKGGGSLQEDRSIASGDIDGRDSGIFSKISKRYGQVQADKRIEAKLEE